MLALKADDHMTAAPSLAKHHTVLPWELVWQQPWPVQLLVGELRCLFEVDVLDAGCVGAEVPDPAVAQLLPPHRLQDSNC